MIADVLRRLHRRPELVFGGAAALLVPWIVVLALTQVNRGVAPNVEPLRLALVGVVLVLAATLIARAGTAPRAAAIVGGALAGFALSAAWFDLVTRAGLPATRLVTRLGLYTALTGALGALLALRCLSARPGRHRVLRGLLGAALVVFTLEATSVVTNRTFALPVTNLDVAWVGLDVGELVGLTGLALALRAKSRLVLFVGPATAALLASDAAINVLTAGDALSVLAALGMAVVELGLATLAVACALRTARLHQGGPPIDRDTMYR